MKKTTYSLMFAGLAALTLSSCAGSKDYDAYVETLKAQPAVIDTISSPASYAVYLDSLADKAKAFDQLGVQLDRAQKAELFTLSQQIEEALTAKFGQLAAEQKVAEEAELDASAPVEPFSQTENNDK